ncbi:MAG: hypothetical protein VKJ02_05975 [Snowella sp.]|nr:hypothetical protein [Snowella sp.]
MIQAIAEQIKHNALIQYWPLVKSTSVLTEVNKVINQKIDKAIETINQTPELGNKIHLLETLKDELNVLVELGQNRTDDERDLTLQYLALLENFYQSLLWLEKLENSSATPEIYWSVLYHCVDRLEKVLQKIQTIQNLININTWDESLFLIESILKEILQIDLEKEQEKTEFYNEKTAIRRIILSGLQLIDQIQHQNTENQKQQLKAIALSQLKAKIEQRKNHPPKESQQNIDFEEYFYQKMDSFRASGWKLYHP